MYTGLSRQDKFTQSFTNYTTNQSTNWPHKKLFFLKRP